MSISSQKLFTLVQHGELEVLKNILNDDESRTLVTDCKDWVIKILHILYFVNYVLNLS